MTIFNSWQYDSDEKFGVKRKKIKSGKGSVKDWNKELNHITH